MEDELGLGLGGSADGSLADPYDMAMAQMQAHMLVAEDGDDMHSLDAASGHSDEELRIIMDAESRTGFVPVSAAAPAVAQAARSAATSRGQSSGRGRAATGQQRTPVQAARGDKENRTRARPRKPHEPDPFLSIDTLPTEKMHRQSAPSRERSVGAQKGSSVAVRKKHDSSGRQTKAPPGTPSHPMFHAPSSRSRMSRNVSSAVSSEWNPLVPRQKPLSGAALENPINRHVKLPFKHTVNKPDMDKALRPMTPSQTMKERTMLATFQLARTMARQRGEEEDKPGGRLLKGRLKPLYPVRVDGPSMNHCKGVVAEDNSLMNSDSRTLARRRKIMSGMLNKDFLFERPPTAESLHHTSVASDLSEGREKDLDDMVVEQEKHPELPTPPQDGMREPPNSLASASDPNFRHTLNATSASGLSSDVFEIDEIPRTMHTDQLPHQHTIEEVSLPSTAHDDTKQRPSTAKAVRFADNNKPIVEGTDTAGDNETAKDSDNKAEQFTDGCRPQSDVPQKREPDDDPDNQGGSQDRTGPSTEQMQGSQGQTEGQTQDSSQGQSSDQGQTGGNQESSGTRGHVASDSSDANHAMKVSYTTVLYTSDEVKLNRMGTVLPPKSNKSKKKSKIKPAQIKLSSKSVENMSNISVEAGGRGSPTKDFYDKFARKSQSAATPTTRPQTAGAADSPNKPLLLRRPISAKDPQVQFVVGPGADSGVSEQDELPTNSPRLNEMRCPMSARTQASGGPSTTRDFAMEPTVPRVKPQEPERDFKVEGSKMSQAIRAGMCTECGKSTTKIAEYWEETGALVCDVCNRRTRAEEERKIEWIRKQMNSVYTGECDKEGNPTEAVHMVTENGEIGGVNNLDDLEKALNAVHCEINEAIRDVCDDEASWISEDEDSEDEELLALTTGEDTLEGPEQEAAPHPHIKDTSPRTMLDEDPENTTAGQMSRVLTEMNADPASLSEYEMRVYWYQEYCQTREKQRAAVRGSGRERRRQVSAGGQVYEALQRETGHQADSGDISSSKMTLMTEQNPDPVTELLQQGAQPATTPAGRVQHFKGQRVSEVQGELVDDTLTEGGSLGVSGRAKKLLRNPSAKKPEPKALAPFAPLCFRINARPPPNYLYYFAYGADMNPDRMATYLQRPVAGGRLWGLLYGFQLVFNKRGVDEEAGAFPNIQLETGASVEGCLYLITLEELDKVDRQVGYPQHYEHAMLPVWLLNCSEPEQYGVAQYCVPALVYVAKDEWIHKGGSPLSTDYAVQQCVKGGGDMLSATYRDHLTALTVS